MVLASLPAHSHPMNTKLLLCALLSAAVLALGCKPEPTTSQQLDKIKTETKQTAQEIKDYSFEQRAEFIRQMQNQLTTLDLELNNLSTKVEGASDAVKAQAKPKLQALRDQANQLSKQLEEIKNATESTWDNLKVGSRKTHDALKEGFQQARQWVSDKIAP